VLPATASKWSEIRMNDEKNPSKGLARRRFLSLLGKSALGLWLLQLIPAVPAFKPPVRRKQSSFRNSYAARVKTHPLAVKREERG